MNKLTKEQKDILNTFPKDGSPISIEQIAEQLPLTKREKLLFVQGVKNKEKAKAN